MGRARNLGGMHFSAHASLSAAKHKADSKCGENIRGSEL